MGSPNLVPSPRDGDWNTVRRAIAKLASIKLGPGSTPTFGGLGLSGDLDMNDNAITDVGYIDFNLTNGIANAEGRLHWNDTDGTLNLGMPGGDVNLQIGQETLVRVKNTSGGTLANGTVVYVSGASGVNVEVDKPIATNPATAPLTFGVTTEEILNNQFGYVTLVGNVRDVNTSGTPVSETWAAGDVLWLSTTTAGEMTKVRPTAPNTAVVIGVVTVANASNGVISVNPTVVQRISLASDVYASGLAQGDVLQYSSDNSRWENSGVLSVQLEPTGFPNITDSTISFNVSSPDRTFTIAPAVTSFDYYRRGKKVTKSSSQTVQIDDTDGLHFIYFDSTDTLVSSLTPWTFDGNMVFVATVYWRAGGSDYLLQEERHGLTMDWATHKYLHETVGVSYESGFTGTFNDNNTCTVTAGELHDEDIQISIAQKTATRVFYRDGVTGYWNFDAEASGYYKEAAGVIQYDNNGVLADVTNGSYVSYYVYGTNDTSAPLYSIMGQRIDTTLANAQENQTLGSLSLSSLPSAEMKPLWQIILRRSGTSETVQDTIDLRSLTALTSGNFVAQDHGSLGGLSDDDHPQYLLADGTRAMTGDLDLGNNNLLNPGTGHDAFTDFVANEHIDWTNTTEDLLTTGQATINGVYPGANDTYDLGLIATGGDVSEVSMETYTSSLDHCTTTRWLSQSFTTVGAFDLTRVDLRLRNAAATSRDVTARIYATSGDSPTGSSLGSVVTTVGAGEATGADGDWISFVFASPISLSATTKYAIVISATALTQWWGSTANPYAGGAESYSTNSGGGWTNSPPWDVAFKAFSTGASATTGWKDLYLTGNLSDGTDELTVANAKAAYDHSLLTDIHTDHTGVTLTAGVGLTGGGDISANRTFDLDVNGLTVDSDPDGAADYLATYDTDAAGHKKILVQDAGPFGPVESTQTINLLASDSTAQKQAKIDAVGRYIKTGEAVTFQFETSNTHTETDYLEFAGFVGGGEIYIYGDTGEAGATTLHTNQNTILDFTNDTDGLRITNNEVRILIRNLRILVDTDVADTKCIFTDIGNRTDVWYCSFQGNGTTRGRGVTARYMRYVQCYRDYVDNLKYGLTSSASRLHDWDNDDTGTSPVYGVWSNQAGQISKQSTAISGSTADELIDDGSFVIPFMELNVDGSIYMKEQAAASADTTAYGQLWIKDDTPNVPKFTDDAGTDFSIGISDGTTGGTGSAGSGNQYIELNIGGTTYKVLHDGTV